MSDAKTNRLSIDRVAVIAAAGRGTRFSAELPKVLAPVHGTPCLQRVLDAVDEGLGHHRQLIIVGRHNAEQVRDSIGEAPHRRYVVQEEPRGTGHALLTALDHVRDIPSGSLYFFCGDKPLLSGTTVSRFRRRFEAGDAPMMFLTGKIQGGREEVIANKQGRVVCIDHNGAPHALAIVERKVIDSLRTGQLFQFCNGMPHFFTREKLLAIRDVNVSTYAWSLAELRQLAPLMSSDNAQGEYLVTDLVELFLRHKHPVQTIELEDSREGLGIDTQAQWQEICALR